MRDRVRAELDSGRLWPHPRVGLNPSFEFGDSITDLIDAGVLDPANLEIFRRPRKDGLVGEPLRLWRHQSEAVHAAAAGRNYVLTTGTGSGKSLSYMIPIVDHVLSVGSGGGVKALVVYPMNALANSQMGELRKFLGDPDVSPVSYARYTGQENEQQRERIRRDPPDVLLTNYVMLELVLTRYIDRDLVKQPGGVAVSGVGRVAQLPGSAGSGCGVAGSEAEGGFRVVDAALRGHLGDVVDGRRQLRGSSTWPGRGELTTVRRSSGSG